jgi:hypothetical protein
MLAWSFGIVAAITVTEAVGEVARRWHADRTWRQAERVQARQDRKRKATFVLTVETRADPIRCNDGSAPAWRISTHYRTTDPAEEMRRTHA